MSLKDKASRIKFPLGATSSAPATTSDTAPKTKTAPGAMMAFANDRRSEMLKENEELKKRAESVVLIQARLDETIEELKQWEGAKGVRALDPNKISRSNFANRHVLNFEGPDFVELKQEIGNAGRNIQPIKVRPIKDKAGVPSYEIVYGHRRHEACRQLGIDVYAIVDNLDDQALFVEMERENRSRKNLSAWEQGVMYRRALQTGLFPSNRKLAEAIGVDLGAVGKAVALAELPDEVVAAFSTPMDLQFRWAKPLKDALDANKDRVFKSAKALSLKSPRLKASEVFAELIGQAGGGGLNGSTPPSESTVVSGPSGQTATIKKDSNGNTVVNFSQTLDAEKCKKLSNFLSDLLKT
jgi:ParB family chromosome partitioning protein